MKTRAVIVRGMFISTEIFLLWGHLTRTREGMWRTKPTARLFISP